MRGAVYARAFCVLRRAFCNRAQSIFMWPNKAAMQLNYTVYADHVII